MSTIKNRAHFAQDNLAPVEAEYTALAPTYNQRWRHYLDVSTARTLAALKPRDGERILDAGCGTGFLLQRIAARAPGAHLLGVDQTPAMLRRADWRWSDRAVADIRCLPLSSESFDAVIIASVLQYLPSLDPVFSEVARVLRPGGRVVITAWDGRFWTMHGLIRWLWWRDFAPVHLHNPHDLAAVCHRHQLTVGRTHQYAVRRVWHLLTMVATKDTGTVRATSRIDKGESI